MNLDLCLKKETIVDNTIEKVVEHACTATAVNDIDRMTQKSSSSTDVELIKVEVEVLKEKSKYLKEKYQQIIINLFTEFSDIWLRPKVAQACKSLAKYEIEGPPVVTILRKLVLKFQVELDKQLNDMLKSSIISLLKSEWSSIPTFMKKKDTT